MNRKVLINAKIFEDLLKKMEIFRIKNKLTSGEFEFLLEAELKVVKTINHKLIFGNSETIDKNEVEFLTKKFVS